MTRNKPANKQSQRSNLDRVEALWKQFIVSLFEFLGQFGLAGIVLIMVYFFVANNASEKQKQEIIDSYVLFKGQSNVIFVLGVLTIFAIIIFVGTRYYYRRQLKAKDARIEELAKEKTKLQKKLLNSPLHSSKPKAKKGRK